MKNITQAKLIAQFKAAFKAETGDAIDFKSHQFLENPYGATPTFTYDFAESVVSHLYLWAQRFIEENSANYPHFGGWEYNLTMTCESLRSSSLKMLIMSVTDDLTNNFIDEYRTEGNKIFKYSAEDRAYIFDGVK